MVVPSNDQELVYNVRLSTVGPGQVTGTEATHEPTGLDLAMKLHYLRAVHLFGREASEGLTIRAIKDAMFPWFVEYYFTCGRFRRDGAGRPYIKCNDCGARFVEAKSDKTVEEWIELLMEDPSLDRLLAYQQVIGPEIEFSPPVYLQVTRLEGGGMSLGLSWAHVLGDPFSASKFMKAWGMVLAQIKSFGKAQKSNKEIVKSPNPIKGAGGAPLSIKRVDPVGDMWITSNDMKMKSFSFSLSANQVTHLQENMCHQIVPPFEAICATIWKFIAKIKGDDEPKIVTIVKNDSEIPARIISTNTQIISTVKTNICIAGADAKELAQLMTERAVFEGRMITEEVEKDNGAGDFVFYGTNLTFVDLGEAPLYKLEINGHKPIFVGYTIQGIGEKGLVLVHPQPEEEDKGRVVSITLPENDMLELMSELKKNGLLL